MYVVFFVGRGYNIVSFKFKLTDKSKFSFHHAEKKKHNRIRPTMKYIIRLILCPDEKLLCVTLWCWCRRQHDYYTTKVSICKVTILTIFSTNFRYKSYTLENLAFRVVDNWSFLLKIITNISIIRFKHRFFAQKFFDYE